MEAQTTIQDKIRSNEIEFMNHWREIAKSIMEDVKWPIGSGSTEEELATYHLSKALETLHDEDKPQSSGVYEDLLGSALGSVNWHEIAKSIMEAVKEMEEA
jgi:hypothetical protein